MLLGLSAGSKNGLCRWVIGGCIRSSRVARAALVVSGTACYYFPDWAEGGLAAGVLYTLPVRGRAQVLHLRRGPLAARQHQHVRDRVCACVSKYLRSALAHTLFACEAARLITDACALPLLIHHLCRSFFHVTGSVGFLAFLFDASPMCGKLGFVLGSAFIGVTQSWKVARLSGRPGGPPRWASRRLPW